MTVSTSIFVGQVCMENLSTKLDQDISPEFSHLLQSTIVVPIPGQLQPPRKPLVSFECCLTQTELLHLVIEVRCDSSNHAV